MDLVAEGAGGCCEGGIFARKGCVVAGWIFGRYGEMVVDG